MFNAKQKMEILDSLEKIGLTKNESKVYLFLVSEGPSIPLTISKRTVMHRSNVYDALKNLQEKGLVCSIFKSDKKFFKVSDPSRLSLLLNKQYKQITQRKVLLKEILPLLKTSNKSKNKNQVAIYSGLEGIKSIFEQILKDKKTNHVLGAWDTYYLLRYYFENWHQRRVKLKIKDKMLFRNAKADRLPIYDLPYTEVRFLPKQFSSPMAVNIFGNKVALVFGFEEEPLAILINNKNIAKNFLDYFEILWKLSSKSYRNS